MDPGRGRERPDLTDPAGPPARERRRLALDPPLLWHLVTLAAGALFLMYVNRGQWFFGDEWEFLTDRTVTIGHDGLFEPHNEHWSTIPILLYGLAFRLAGISSYAPYVILVVAAHLVVVHLAWRVMLRSAVAPWIATAFCAALIPFGPGADNLLWAFQIGFVGSVAFGLAAVLWMDRDTLTVRGEGTGWGLSILGLACSGISIPLVAGTAAVSWMRRGFGAFVRTTAVPAAVFLVWFVSVGRSGLGEEGPTRDSLRVFHEFAGRGLEAVLALGTPTILAGAIPLGLSVAALVLRRRRGIPLPHAALGAALGWLLLLVMLAVLRAPLGIEAAAATRYVHIGAALLLPLLAVGPSDLFGRRAVGVALVALLAVPWGVHNAILLAREATLQADRERLIREQLVAAGTLFDGETLLDLRPDLVYTPDLGLTELKVLLPGFSEGVIPSREAVLSAALSMQVSATGTPEFVPSAPLPQLAAEGAQLDAAPLGCFRALPVSPEARLLVPLGSSVSFGVASPAHTWLDLAIVAGGIRPDYGWSVEIAPGRTVYLNVGIDERLAGAGDLLVEFAAPLRICPT